MQSMQLVRVSSDNRIELRENHNVAIRKSGEQSAVTI